MSAHFEGTDKVELANLDKLIKAMKSPPTLKVGILGGGENATIGAVHEFGAPARNIPQRSFLRVPISEHLSKKLEEDGVLTKEHLAEVIKTGSIAPWMRQVGVTAVGIVDDAFESSGDGKWRKWKDPKYTNEGGMLLVDTGGLRDSITSEVTE
jgi:phage gpG-like protein